MLAPLGAGTFGSVWRVRDLSLGREVALKLLHPHVARDERAVGRFRREARLAAQLAHPAIVPIYDWDSRGDVAWYTMELAEGGSVGDLIARAGPRPLAEIAPQVDGVLSGLAAAHAVGIIHRDLKPENMLIDRYRRWRIADFGIANPTGEETTGASGTPAFSPPEQLLGEPQEAPADCFSLAAIVVFVLTGEAPFGDTRSRRRFSRASSRERSICRRFRPRSPRGCSVRSPRTPTTGSPTRRRCRPTWRTAATAVLERERRVPWWRRIFGGEESATAGGARATPSSSERARALHAEERMTMHEIDQSGHGRDPGRASDALGGGARASARARRGRRRAVATRRRSPSARPWWRGSARCSTREKDQLGRLMTLEMGKPIQAAIDEAAKCAAGCRYYAEHGRAFVADAAVDDDGHRSLRRRISRSASCWRSCRGTSRSGR